MNASPLNMVIRRYSSRYARFEITERVHNELLPALRQEPAFRALFVALNGTGSRFFEADSSEGISVAVMFDDPAKVQRMNDHIVVWAGAALANLLTNNSSLVIQATAEVSLDAVSKGGEGHMFVWKAQTRPRVNALPVVQDKLVPMMQAQPGFRHFYAGQHMVEPRQTSAVSIFTDHSTAFTAYIKMREIMDQNRPTWPLSSQAVLAGDVFVTAFA